MPKKPACGGGGPKAVAARTPSQAAAGCGAANRSAPTGGAANGMPRKTARPASPLPRTRPAATFTSRDVMSADGAQACTRVQRGFAPIRIRTGLAAAPYKPPSGWTTLTGR